MITIFDVTHKIVRKQQPSRKGIGIYTNIISAQSAINRLKEKSGFIDPRGHFSIFPCELDTDYLPDGYDTERRALPPLNTEHNFQTANDKIEQVFGVYNMSSNNAYEFDDDFVMIGYYTTRSNAEAAITRAEKLPNFKAPDRRSGIDLAVLNRDNWTSGFISGEEALKPFR